MFFDLFGTSEKKTHNTCISIYEKAKKERPNKAEKDYLKIVLLTKSPFDYQHDKVINYILDEQVKNIKELSEFVFNFMKNKELWQNRERNLKHLSNIKERNKQIFDSFWNK